MFKQLTLNVIVASGLTAALTACGGSNNSSSSEAENPPAPVVTSNCFWQGPYVRETPVTNFAYPDTGAAYWSAQYTLPQGASLKLKGDYPYARYMSFNSYRNDASPAHALSDDRISPNPGSKNPFINGNARQDNNRSYEITLASGERPDSPAENTLYDYAENQQATLLYRLYVPDENKNVLGGVALPSIELTTAGGEVLQDEAACAELSAQQKLVDVPLVPAQTYAMARQNNPARNPSIWKAAYNFDYSIKCSFFNLCEPNPVRQVGWFANLDNQYISNFIDRSIEPIVVIRGKIPKVPATLKGNETFDTSEAQLRYWSICQNEYYSQKVTACLYDEQIQIDADGFYTIVTSRLADRPSNATDACGIGYLPWSDDGDGFGIIEGQENSTDDALLIIRNMLPMNGFEKTVQQTQTPGDETATLAEFMPVTQYFSQEAFEALGCDAHQHL